ncbi:MAG: hypothetical protein WCL07_04520 [bacterium]
MSNKEIWGMEPKEIHELIGTAEVATGAIILTASILLISSGVGCLGGIIGGIGGLRLIVDGSKEIVNAKYNPKYRD